MRCLSCDVGLSDQESTRKFLSGEYVDLCNKCFESIKNDVQVFSQSNDDDDLEDE